MRASDSFERMPFSLMSSTMELNNKKWWQLIKRTPKFSIVHSFYDTWVTSLSVLPFWGVSISSAQLEQEEEEQSILLGGLRDQAFSKVKISGPRNVGRSSLSLLNFVFSSTFLYCKNIQALKWTWVQVRPKPVQLLKLIYNCDELHLDQKYGIPLQKIFTPLTENVT